MFISLIEVVYSIVITGFFMLIWLFAFLNPVNNIQTEYIDSTKAASFESVIDAEADIGKKIRVKVTVSEITPEQKKVDMTFIKYIPFRDEDKVTIFKYK